MMQTIGSDHSTLVQALAQREAAVAVLRVEQEKERTAAIAQAQKEVDEYDKLIAPKVAEAAKQRAAEIARLVAEEKKSEASLPARQQVWEKKQSATIEWIPLRPASVQVTEGFTTAVLADRSVLVNELDEPAGDDKVSKAKAKAAKARAAKRKATTITVNVPTTLRGISGIRLEALADAKLPGGGPGLANGNFVLTQMQVTATAKNDPQQTQSLVLEHPQADFNQDKFSVAGVVNLAPDRNVGWGVGPAVGSSHWAVFEIKEPVGYEGGTQLTFRLNHLRGADFVLGRFRISVAIEKAPLPLGLSEDLQSALNVPAAGRDAENQQLLAKYYRGVDEELRKVQAALAESKQPLPTDPKLLELRENLELVSRPILPDSQLVQLREDAKMSTGQLANRRLTAAQDLAWALINSPAFLFNH
jgi:hypothetical protein